MDNKETGIDKVTETLTKELESLSAEEIYEFFKFIYKTNHAQENMMLFEHAHSY